MAQIFGRKFNTIAKVSIVGAAVLVGGLLFLLDRLQRSPYATEVEWTRSQPVPFTHQHHVSGLGIDCRYCHTAVEESSSAGIPPTSTCMNCHSQIWTDAPMLEPVRESYRTGKPIEWERVHDLPGFVYFNHSIHINKGVGCSTCHGRIDKMPLTWKANTLYMQWCLECHKQPEKFLREKKDIYNMEWKPRADQMSFGMKLREANHVESNIHCSTCHR
jgi:hypothetical protein